MVSCRNVHIRRFLDDIAESKHKRTTEHEDEAEEEQDGAGLVLKPPPPGRKPDIADGANTLISKLRRVGSQKHKKAVSFVPPSTEADTRNPAVSGSADHAKRTRHVLRKQDSFETAESSGDNVGDADFGLSRLGHQRGMALKGKNPFSRGPGKKAGLGRFRAIASRVMKESEHKSGDYTLRDAAPPARSEKGDEDGSVELTNVVVDKALPLSPTTDDTAPTEKVSSATATEYAETTQGHELAENNAGSQDAAGTTSTNDAQVRKDAVNPQKTKDRRGGTAQRDDNKTSKANAPPIATPESLSPATSMEGRADSPVDVLEILRPVPPGSPVKNAEFFSESINGSVTSKMTSPHGPEREAQLSRTRMWHRMCAEEASDTESAVSVRLVPEQKIDCSLSESIQAHQVQNGSENQRETNV